MFAGKCWLQTKQKKLLLLQQQGMGGGGMCHNRGTQGSEIFGESGHDDSDRRERERERDGALLFSLVLSSLAQAPTSSAAAAGLASQRRRSECFD